VKPAALREHRQRLRAKGICVICHREPARPNRINCEACAKRALRLNDDYTRRMKADPYRCTTCGKRGVEMGRLCDNCYRLSTKHRRAVAARRREAQQCVGCGVPIEAPSRRCAICREANTQQVALRRALRG